MSELLRNSLLGWSDYNFNGKFSALLFLVLLYFYLRKDSENGRRNRKAHTLLIYTVVMLVCCIFPVTAALLMTYQTRFYDYQWIMNYIPVTMVIAYGATVFLAERWEMLRRGATEQKALRVAGVTALVVGLIIFCGEVRQPVFDGSKEYLQRESAKVILAELADTAEEEALCLWAPQEIMASARAQQPDIYLIYGRNMWDAALGAYTYETYGDVEEKLYQWMHYAETFGTLDAVGTDRKVIEGVTCVKDAVAAGVNRIILPVNMQEDAVRALEDALDASVQKLGDYYLFVI